MDSPPTMRMPGNRVEHSHWSRLIEIMCSDWLRTTRGIVCLLLCLYGITVVLMFQAQKGSRSRTSSASISVTKRIPTFSRTGMRASGSEVNCCAGIVVRKEIRRDTGQLDKLELVLTHYLIRFKDLRNVRPSSSSCKSWTDCCT